MFYNELIRQMLDNLRLSNIVNPKIIFLDLSILKIDVVFIFIFKSLLIIKKLQINIYNKIIKEYYHVHLVSHNMDLKMPH